MKKKLLLLMTLSIIIIGCDTVHGVIRYSTVNTVKLPVKCIIDSLEVIKGISNIKYQTEEGSQRLTFNGIEQPEIIDRFSYTYDGLYGNFYFITNEEGVIEFRHTYIGINYNPPEIGKMKQIMLKIENSVSQRCEIDVSTNIIEDIK
ncbi:hypothetical protein [Sulfurimonas sp.]|uniref:hypothetical protein n=1 Tax=Sulfurimonas sp. TaxID=2022749 RepID=UPI003D0A8321